MPEHASHNPAKKMLDWDYVIEILQSDLRTRLAEWCQTQMAHNRHSDEVSISQDPGVFYVSHLPSEAQAVGGDHHV